MEKGWMGRETTTDEEGVEGEGFWGVKKRREAPENVGDPSGHLLRVWGPATRNTSTDALSPCAAEGRRLAQSHISSPHPQSPSSPTALQFSLCCSHTRIPRAQ